MNHQELFDTLTNASIPFTTIYNEIDYLKIIQLDNPTTFVYTFGDRYIQSTHETPNNTPAGPITTVDNFIKYLHQNIIDAKAAKERDIQLFFQHCKCSFITPSNPMVNLISGIIYIPDPDNSVWSKILFKNKYIPILVLFLPHDQLYTVSLMDFDNDKFTMLGTTKHVHELPQLISESIKINGIQYNTI
jgi:hypothetical protein